MGHILQWTAVAATIAAASPAAADSFSLSDFSAADFGRANAGRVTYTDDAGVAFANPALMSLMMGREIMVQVSGIFADGEFTDSGSADVLGGPLGASTGDVFTTSVVPSVYAIMPLTARLTAGLAVNTPFGLSTEYNNDWPGRYQALTSELTTINLNPSLAFRVNDQFSIGAGVSFQYADATLSNAIDFGAACLGALDGATCGGLGLLPQAADGEVVVTGDSWGVGFNAGLAYEPHPDVRIGAHFRSGVEHSLEGEAGFNVPTSAAPLLAGGGFVDTDAGADINLPASVDVGVRWQATEAVALYGTVQWMDWSQIEDITVTFDNAAQAPSAEIFNYQDAYRYGVGADWTASEKLTLRAGFAIDTVPADSPLPSVRVPDGERAVYALGGTWSCSEQIAVHASFSHIAIEENTVNRTGTFGETVQGSFDSNVPVVSVGVSFKF